MKFEPQKIKLKALLLRQNKTMKFPDKAELLERFGQYSDQQLLQMLRRPRDYQPSAIEAATDLARERGLEWTPDSAPDTKPVFSLFPHFRDAQQARKTAQSIQRLLFFVPLVPLLSAGLQWIDGFQLLAVASVLLALSWGLLTYFSFSRRRHQLVWLFFPLLALLLLLRFQSTGFPFQASLTDWLVVTIALIVLVYLLLFYKSTLKSGF